MGQRPQIVLASGDSVCGLTVPVADATISLLGQTFTLPKAISAHMEASHMENLSGSPDTNVYQNLVTGATPNPVMPNPDAIDKAFAERANQVLSKAVELVRDLIGAHQSAIAIIVQKDWQSARKFFSLSPKYAAWADYKNPRGGLWYSCLAARAECADSINPGGTRSPPGLERVWDGSRQTSTDAGLARGSADRRAMD